MKLLIVTGIYPPDIGGPATFVPLLANDALGRFEEVCVVTLGNEMKTSTGERFNLISISRSLPKAVRVILTTLVILSKAKKADAIFCNGLYLETSLVLRVLKRRSLAKIVGDPVWEKARNSNRTSLDIENFQQVKWEAKDKFTNWIFCKAWKTFDLLTCPSPALVRMIENRMPEKRAIYIPNGVDKPRDFHSKKEFALITISRLVSWKNINSVIEAASILKTKLIIVGDGPERNRLEALARERNAQAEFVGTLTSSQVLSQMEKAKYFLQMSDYEGLSFSLLESMSCGLVPIVSGNDGNRIVVIDGHNGVISEIDGTSIAEAIRSVENQIGKYEELSREAISTVSFSFDGKMKREQMLNLLSDII